MSIIAETPMSETEKTEPVLPTYDPNWAQRHDRLVQQIRTADHTVSPQEMERRVAAMHAAFHAQFRTAGDYAAWMQKNMNEQAAREGKVLAQASPPKGATIDQVESWGAAAYQALRRLDFPQLASGQPAGLQFFHDTLPDGARRAQVSVAIAGYRGAEPVRTATIERQASGLVGICLHESVKDGLAIAPVVGHAATHLQKTLFPDVEPTRLRFFVYAPPEFGGPLMGEQFVNVGMKYGRHGYYDPGVKYYDKVPAVIRQANDGQQAFYAPYAPRRPAGSPDLPPSPRLRR